MIELAPIHESVLDYDQAFLYCLTLSYNNHKDWRLPTNPEYAKTNEIPTGSWYIHRSGGVIYDTRARTVPVRTL